TLKPKNPILPPSACTTPSPRAESLPARALRHRTYSLCTASAAQSSAENPARSPPEPPRQSCSAASHPPPHPPVSSRPERQTSAPSVPPRSRLFAHARKGGSAGELTERSFDAQVETI